jgi:hypothetical protein
VLYFGIYCPPALEAIKNRTGMEITASSGDKRFCDAKTLEKALS